MQREGRGSQLIALILMLTFTGQTVIELIAPHTESDTHGRTYGVRRIAVIFYLVGIYVSVAADKQPARRCMAD